MSGPDTVTKVRSPRSRSRTPARTAATEPVASSLPSSPARRVVKPTENSATRTEQYEFGGPLGVTAIMILSHIILYWVFYSIKLNGGAWYLPKDGADVSTALTALFNETNGIARPTWLAAKLYFIFIVMETVFAYVMPGLRMTGRPDELGNRLVYHCNAYLSWWATLLFLVYDVYSPVSGTTSYLKLVYDNLGSMMTVAVIFGNVLSLAIYVYALASRSSHRMSGNHIYDFFMGGILHPRLGTLDIKMFAEIRISWFLLFILTASCAAHSHAETGSVAPSLQVMLLAHFLYANACAKGEHYVPPTWDIFYEKFGWMLCFWNFAGVPFLYCAQSLYVAEHKPALPTWLPALLAVVLVGAYYVWDTSQSQKNHFRLEFSGEVVERFTIPRLPWQIINKPQYVDTARGSPLLADGWWKYARKIHYTCDIVMAFVWGATCGFSHTLPFFYFFFFTCMIMHRYLRDFDRCSKKYGKDWDVYVSRVPYAFIPGVV